MNNASELREEMGRVWYDLRHKKIDAKTAGELANVAGKMIGSAKVQVEYFALLKRPTEIAFLNEPLANVGKP